MEIWSVRHGSALKRIWTIKDDDGNPIAFEGSEPLSLKIWAGDEQAALVTTIPDFALSEDGTVNIAVSEAQVSSLPVGQCSALLTVTTADGTFEAGEWSIEVSPAPGDEAALATDITFQDMLLYSPHIETLFKQNVDLAGFLGARNRARTWYQEQVRDNYRPVPGRSMRMLSADGTTSGPYLRFSPGPGGADAPSPDDVFGYLQAGGLKLTDRIRETQAHFASAVVLLGLPGRQNDYQQAGTSHMARAAALYPQCVNDIDPLGGSSPTIRVHRDCIFLT